MQMDVKLDTSNVEKMIKRYPVAAEKALTRFTEKAGRTVERHAKKRAPVVHGYLRRSINFIPAGGGGVTNFTGSGEARKTQSFNVKTQTAVVVAYAEYAEQVHGQPFYTNARPRKETPFFTFALMDSQTAIQQYARDILTEIPKYI